MAPSLCLRRIVHPQARENYRVVLKDDGDEIEIGSIGVQSQSGTTKPYWVWGIDTLIPMREADAEGRGKDRRDCQRQFQAAWGRFAADEARLSDFLREKRKRMS